MATELGKAYVQIVPSAKGIGRAISSEIMPASDKAGKSAGLGIGSMIKGAILTAGIGQAIISTIKEGGKLEQSLGGIETLFKKNADTVKKYANDAYKTTGLSANAYMESVTGFSASLLQSLGGDTKKSAQVANMAMIDMADNSNKMGTSMEMIQNAYQGFAKQNYTMLDNLKLGYGGTKTEMQRLLKDAQKITGVKYDINNLSDVYNAIHAIQGKLDITGTTAKEASTTIMGSFSAMSASFSNVLGALALGEGLKPALQSLAITTSTFLFQNLFPMIGNIISQLPSALMTFLSVAIPQFMEMGGKLVRSIMDGFNNSIGTGMVDFASNFDMAIQEFIMFRLVDFAEKGFQLLTQLGNGFINAIPTIITNLGLIWESIVGYLLMVAPQLMNEGYKFISNLGQGFMNNLPAIEKSIGDILSNLLQDIIKYFPIVMMKGYELIGKLSRGFINNLPAVLIAIGRILLRLLGVIVSNLPNIFQKGFQFIGMLAKGFVSNLGAVIGAIGKILLRIINAIVGKFGEVSRKGFEFVANFARGIIGNIGAGLNAIGNVLSGIKNRIISKISSFASIGGDLIRGLWNGISDKTGWIIDRMGGFASSVVSRIKGFFGVHSPSTVFAEIGGYLDEGLAKGIVDNTRPVENAMKNLSETTKGSYESELSYKINNSKINDDFNVKTTENKIVELLNQVLSSESDIYIDGDKVGKLLNPLLAQTITEASL